MVWKCDIRLGCKALRLKAKDADQIDYCHLPKELKNRVNDFNYLHNAIFEFLVMRQGRASACDVGKMAVVRTASDFGGIRETSVLSEFVGTMLQALEF